VRFHRRGFTLIELLVVITIIGILITLALPNFIKAKDKALEAQIKANVHNIRLSLERYGVDNDGQYPHYIFGGSISSWTNGSGSGNAGFIKDPLIFFAYIVGYPRNPFVKDGRSLCLRTNLDPRFGCMWPTGSTNVFGGDDMGNILSDPNMPGADINRANAATPAGSLSPVTLPAGATATLQPQVTYYFIGDDNNDSVDWLPGQFAYRSFGLDATLVRQIGIPTGTTVFQAMVIDYYVIMGYGSIRSNGKDYIHCVNTLTNGDGLGGKPSRFGRPPRAPCNNVNNFNPAGNTEALWENEPRYGGFTWGGGTGLGVLPNTVFVFAKGPVGGGLKLEATNADGRFDGIILFYGAGTEAATGQ
jgi:prepilin-type N-terminal cleavage/methylation domain-containing protein